MSMHFAPQWVKPIKPTGSSALNSESHSPTISSQKSITPATPFPALSNSVSSLTQPTPPPMSYSRVTHTPTSSTFPSDGAYFPSTDGSNGDEVNPYPFRYSKEQILALWEEEKVKETPIEFVEMLENGGVLGMHAAKRPIGLRDLTDVEKKLLTTSVHPPQPVRRPQTHSSTPAPAVEPVTNGVSTRRSGPNTPGATRDPAQPVGRGFGGFGRGEGGALGGGAPKPGVIGGGTIGSVGEGKAPGVLGGGFGGVGKRLSTRRAEGGEATGEARPWRVSRTASGNFEGVLGFGAGGSNAASSNQHTSASNAVPAPIEEKAELPQSDPAIAEISSSAPGSHAMSWRERMAAKHKEGEESGATFGSGGGPGWGGGQRKWRMGGVGSQADQELPTLSPANALLAASTVASASATPLPIRDAAVEDVATPLAPAEPEQGPPEPQEPAQPAVDPAHVEWFYKDPEGVQQGPFQATQMHDWFSNFYFQDDLPVRRSTDAQFQTLEELKRATGNVVQPFLAVVRPRPPVAAPVAPSPPPPIGPPSLLDNQSLSDSFGGLSMHNQQPLHGDDRFSPAPQPAFQSPFNQPFRNDPPFSPNQFPSQQSPFGQPPLMPNSGYLPPANQPWGAMATPSAAVSRFNQPFGVPGPQGPMNGGHPGFHQQSPFGPHGGAPIGRGPDFFSPSIGVGAPVSPWGAPQQQDVFQSFPRGPLPPNDWQQQQQQQPQLQGPPQPQQFYPPPQQYAPPPPPLMTPPSFEAPIPDEPSYFPQVDQVDPAAPQNDGPEVDEAPSIADDEPDVIEAVEDSSPEQIIEPAEREQEPVSPEEEYVIVPIPVTAPAPPASVWNRSAAPPKPAPIVTEETAVPSVPAPAPIATSTLPPAPASLPPKPVSARQASVSEVPTARTPTSAAPDKVALPPKPAPWALVSEAEKAKTPGAGLSLREIQDAEAKLADARKQALAEIRAAAIPSPAASSTEELPQSMSWGLPSQPKAPAVSSPAIASPATPVWGSGEAGPKKTLKQIQEEEEKRKAKVAAAAQIRLAQVTSAGGLPSPLSASTTKRGYADLAANAASAPTTGWNTVGASGKPVPGAAPVSTNRIVTPASKPTAAPLVKPAPAAPAIPTAVKAAAKVNGSSEDPSAPSVEFIRWIKQALNGISVPIDEIIPLLLDFPVDPPAAERTEQLGTIADMVYAHSSTLDGRRFAQEFYTKRKADVARGKAGGAGGIGGASAVPKVASLAEVLKTQPKAPAQDLGFKIVKAKGKKKN